MFDTDFTKLELSKLIEVVREVDQPTNCYVEIGVFRGGTFKTVLDNTTDLYCYGIDLFEDFIKNEDNTHITGTIHRIELDKELIKHVSYKRYQLNKEDSATSLRRMELGCGVILIDGNHKFYATLMDFILSYTILDSGYILFHNASNTMYPDKDYIESDGGPYKVVELAKTFPKLTYIGTFDRLAIFKKEENGTKA